MIFRLLLAGSMLFASPAFAQLTSFPGESCVDGQCYRTPVRTLFSRQPVRRTVRWVTPTRYTTSYSNPTVVRTYRRGLFGRKIYTGYAAVSSPQAGYGSTGTTTYSTSSAGSYQSYGSAGTTTSYAAPSLENKANSSQVRESRSQIAAECDCNGECDCPCCPCKPQAEAKTTYKLSHAIKPRVYHLAHTIKTRPQDLRLAQR